MPGGWFFERGRTNGAIKFALAVTIDSRGRVPYPGLETVTSHLHSSPTGF